MSDLSQLIERVEAATEGSRELDGSIYIAVNIPPEKVGRIDQLDGCVGWWPKGAPYVSAIEVPPYSTSIDAALTLLPDSLRVNWAGECPDRRWFCELIERNGPYVGPRLWAATAPLALLAAILRARQAADTESQS